MSEENKSISNSGSGQRHHHHHHHHHHRSKHRFSRNKRLLKKIIWPIAILFFAFIIFITFFPDTYKKLFHKDNQEDGITAPKEDKFEKEFGQINHQKTIHFNEWFMMA